MPGRATLASNQVEYSLVNRRAEAEVLPAAEALGLGVLPWSPLGRGVLTGKYRHGTPADSRAASPHFSNFVGSYLDERHARIVEAVARAAEGLDWSPLEVALTWVRDRPGVVAPDRRRADRGPAARLADRRGAASCRPRSSPRSTTSRVPARAD